MNTLMNVWTAFHATPVDKLTTDNILSTLRAKKDEANFMSSPYTCDGKAAPALPAICNAKYFVNQIKNGKPTIVDRNYDAGATILKLPKG
jgi:hypothetical protein